MRWRGRLIVGADTAVSNVERTRKASSSAADWAAHVGSSEADELASIDILLVTDEVRNRPPLLLLKTRACRLVKLSVRVPGDILLEVDSVRGRAWAGTAAGLVRVTLFLCWLYTAYIVLLYDVDVAAAEEAGAVALGADGTRWLVE